MDFYKWYFLIQIVCMVIMIVFYMKKGKSFERFTNDYIKFVVTTIVIVLFYIGLVLFNESVERQKLPKVYTKQELQQIVEYKARQYKIPIKIAKSVAIQESNWNHKAISKAQACGLFQIIPSTFVLYADENMNIFEPEDNIEVAMRYLSHLYTKHKSWSKALAIYNGGYKHWKSKEAQLYVSQVLAREIK